MSGSLTVERSGPVLTVTLGRGKANAIDQATSREMSEVFEGFRDDPDLRVAILVGAGDRFFSAGWDLNAAAAGEQYQGDYGSGGFGGFPELPGLDKPVIVAVNGIAAGGGFELVLAADLVVAVDHAEFLLTEARRGIVPDVGLVRLPKQIPRPIAVELLMGTRRLSAAEAHDLGLVNRVVPAAELREAARDLADQVVAAAPLSVAAILEVIRHTENLSTEDALAWLRSGSASGYERVLASADAEEGVAAFLEKRPPAWRGA